MERRKFLVLIGIFYLLYQFIDITEPVLVQAWGEPWKVDQRTTTTASRQCISHNPNDCDGNYGGRGGSGRHSYNGGGLGERILGNITRGAAQGASEAAVNAIFRNRPVVYESQPPIVVHRPDSYPPHYPQRYPSRNYPPDYRVQNDGSIFISGHGDAVEEIKRVLISMGKLVVLNRQYSSIEMKVIQKRVGNEIQIYVDVIDVMSQSFVDSQVGTGYLVSNSQEAQYQAAQAAVRDVLSRLRIASY